MPRYTPSSLTPTTFPLLWAQGMPLVVEGLLDRFEVPWMPEYFVEQYGGQGYLVIECQSKVNRRVSVGEFFRAFGWYSERSTVGTVVTAALKPALPAPMAVRGKVAGADMEPLGLGVWKRKDWPPSTDFRKAFPELWDDFAHAVLHGVEGLDAAAHGHGGRGEHHDLCVPHAQRRAQVCGVGSVLRGLGIPGIEEYTGYVGGRGAEGWTANDPIHGQQFYLDEEMRVELWEIWGVMSYRFYQRPGEAVFIPAGCVHQVANLADCIKVAVDFVSLENVERCERLTCEFCEQNQRKMWKEDVLQLRTMWYAWVSCRLQEERMWNGDDEESEE
ncbi:hypothetical protein DXG01_003328, partial [Tephrocybe rancida]